MTVSSVAGNVAVVTGASSGIGRTIAHRFAERGMSVLLICRRAQEEAGALTRKGCSAVAITADLALPRDVESCREQLERVDEIAVLVHAAGAYASAPWEDAGSTPRELMQINFHAAAEITAAALPALRRAAGQIVFINSSQALRPSAKVGAYAASKAALKTLADTLRDEVNRDGIRVITVYPGTTATPMQEQIHRESGRPFVPADLLQPEDVASTVLAAIDLPFTAEATDISVRPFRPPGSVAPKNTGIVP